MRLKVSGLDASAVVRYLTLVEACAACEHTVRGVAWGYSVLDGAMSIAMVYAVCFLFVLIMAMFFVGGAIESRRVD